MTEGTGPWLLRRAVSLSALSIALTALVPLGLPLLLLAAVVDAVLGARLALTRTVAMFAVWIVCEAVGVLVAVFIRVTARSRDDELTRTFALQWRWASALLDAACALFSMRVDVRDGECARGGPVLVFARHVSVADTLLAAACLSRPYRLRLRYVLKRELLWDPCLDLVGHRIPNAFVRRNARDTAGDVAAVRALGENLGPDDGVLIYPEGTRATPALRAKVLAKLDASPTVSDAQRAAAHRLAHVLPPRLEGVLALLDAAPEADVVFLSHTGFDRVRSLADLRRGALVGAHIRVQLWRCPRAEIPAEREALSAWTSTWWQRIDEHVGAQG